jgi:L-ribulokinase
VVVVDMYTGAEVMAVHSEYPRWKRGEYCDPARQQFRQHPQDYLDALTACFNLVTAELAPGSVEALAIDATGSTVAPVDDSGMPLALRAEFWDRPECMFWLWKDHTSSAEAARINQSFSTSVPDYTSLQGEYSSEWWWAKILHAVTVEPWLRSAATSWVEHSDWMVGLLTGCDDVRRLLRNSCAAGHKQLYSRRLGGPVSIDVLAAIDAYLADVASTVRMPPVPAGTKAGIITPQWAERLHLRPTTIVGVGSLDAHAGAVGAGVREQTLVKVMGTSTVDMFLCREDAFPAQDLRRVCGFAEDSIVPGYLGGESSQAAFGDLFQWYAKLIWAGNDLVSEPACGGPTSSRTNDMFSRTLHALDRQAALRENTSIVGLDWLNGRRYPDPDDRAGASLLGFRIGDDAVDLYRAIVISAVMGSKRIFECLRAGGVLLDRMILVGGIARKAPWICQLMADALGVEAMVCREQETCARGASIFAAVASGEYSNVEEAQRVFCGPFVADYLPTPVGMREMGDSFERYMSAVRRDEKSDQRQAATSNRVCQ